MSVSRTDLSALVETYIAGQRERKLEQTDKKLAKEADPDKRLAIQGKRQEQVAEYQTERWLDAAVARVSQIRVATHAPKFAHPGVKSEGVFAKVEGSPRDGEIGTHILDFVQADIVGNAAALDVGNLLLIGNTGDTLWRQVLDGDDVSFKRLSDNPEKILHWMAGFAAAVVPIPDRSHALAKQTYFPVEGGYHLVSPQFASSLAHELYLRVEQSRFSNEAKEARKHRASRATYPMDDVRYSNNARMKFGGSNPQNVSLLNRKRGGVVYLLNTAPPEWRTRLSLPLKGKEAFWRLYGRCARLTFENLRSFLERVGDYNDVQVRRRRQTLIDELVDRFLHLVVELRLEGQAGWSQQSELRLAEQCLLDPGRRVLANDDSFASLFDSGDWCDEVSKTFGQYVNLRIGSMKLRGGARARRLGDVEANEWAKVLERELRSLRHDVEALT